MYEREMTLGVRSSDYRILFEQLGEELKGVEHRELTLTYNDKFFFGEYGFDAVSGEGETPYDAMRDYLNKKGYPELL